MKTLLLILFAALSFLGSGPALAQNGNMMNGGFWGGHWMGGDGYGGMGVPLLLAIVVIALVVWIVRRGRK